MSEEIDIKKNCEQCLFKNECEIKNIESNICVWFFDENKYQYKKCNNCGLIYIEEVKNESS